MNNNKKLNVVLWISQIILALMFLMAGVMKSTQPIEELGKNLPWVNEVPLELVRFIGISELLGGIGLIIPSVIRFKPQLTPLAAFGLFIIMVLAFVYHLLNGENSALIFNTILGAIALFIAWGRFKKAPITAK